MLDDRYDMPLTTASDAAREDYLRGRDLLLTLYPGAAEAFDRAIAADPGFAMAHAGKAQALLRDGDVAAARACMAQASAVAAGLPAWEASHVAFFGLLLGGRADVALAALHDHLAAWPRDALVLATTATPNGLMGTAGLAAPKRAILELLDGLAPHYGEDWWFMAHHGMALSEAGKHAQAGETIARSLARNAANAWVAHARAHLCYETGDAEAARAFLKSWLAGYPRDGSLHGHLSWHLALGELELGNPAEATRVYDEAIALDRHSGPPPQRLTDAVAFLWRAELAGQPRDAAAWQAINGFAARALPRPGAALADLHVGLAQIAAGDAAGLEARLRQMEALARDGRYPSGPVVPALSRAAAAFQRRDFAAAIAALEPVAGARECIGGSHAQLDIIEFTLLKAYLDAGRAEEARRLLGTRRPGATGVPVDGLAAIH